MLKDTIQKIIDNERVNDDIDAAISNPGAADENEVIGALHKLKELSALHDELQRFSLSLSKGELGVAPPPRSNYLASGLKQLQMNLRHLTWQTKRISEGDYSQRVDFMGEFSEAFNKMTDQMRERENYIVAQRETLFRIFDQIEPLFIVDKDDLDLIRYANKLAIHRFHLDFGSGASSEHSHPLGDSLIKVFEEKCKPHTIEQINDETSGRWYRVTCEPFSWDHDEDSLLYHCVDITTHVQRESDLEQEAYTDKLTGLNNRYVFERSFDKLWDMCRQNKSPLSIIIFDIDFFKKVNDTYGHLQGDKCLVALADTLRASIGRFNDVIARFGGEEFVALLPFTNEDAAAKIAENVRRKVESMEIPLVTSDNRTETIKITVSGGVFTTIPTLDDIPEELLAEADKALYRAKHTGRNKICIAEIEK